MTSRPAPRVPAGNNSLAALVDLYQRNQNLQNEAEQLSWDLPTAARDSGIERLRSNAVWSAQVQTARAVMMQPVSSSADLLITLGMAASYIGTVVDLLDGEAASIGDSIGTAITNALELLVQQGALHNTPSAVADLLKPFCTLPEGRAA